MMRKYILLILIVLNASTAWSSTNDSLSWYTETAIKNNATVLQRYYEYQAAFQKIDQVESLPNPQLDLGILLQPMEWMNGRQVADIKLMQMFPWFGALKSAKDEKILNATASLESLAEAKLQVQFDLNTLWYELIANKQQIVLLQKNIGWMKTMDQLIQTRFQAGNLSANTMQSGAASSGMLSKATGSTGLSSIYRIQIQIGTMEDEVLTMENKQHVLMAKFNTILNRPLNTSLTIPDSIVCIPLQANLLQEVDTLFNGNPLLNKLNVEMEALDVQSKMQKSMSLPMIGIGLNYSIFQKSNGSTSPMNGKDMLMPMVSLSLPVYRKKYKAEQKEIEWLKAANKQAHQITINELTNMYLDAKKNYLDAQRQQVLYQSQQRLLEQSLTLTIQRFSVSSTSLDDVLQVQQLLLDNELKEIEARVAFNQAKTTIQRIIIQKNSNE